MEWFQQNIESNNDLHSVFFIDDKKGWIAGIDGLFKTINSGENWDRINDASKFNNIYFFDKNKGVISGFNNDIFITDDGGKSLKNYAVETADEGDKIMDISFPNQKFGWLAVLNNNIEKGKVYHTSDSGKTWEKQKSFNEDWVTSVHFLDTLNGWVTLYSNDKYKEKNFHSCDGGKTWLSQSCIDDDLNRFGNLEDIYMLDTLNGWAVGENPNIYYTKNGGQTWNEHYIPGDFLNSVQFISIDKGWAASNNFLYFSTDTGRTWNTYPYNGDINCIFFINELYGYAVGENGYILKTLDGGEYWEYIKYFHDTIILNKVLVTENNKIWISAVNTNNYKEGMLYISTNSAKSFSILKKIKEYIITIAEVGTNLFVLSDSLYKIIIDNYQVVSKKLPVEANFTDMFFIGEDTIWLTGYTGNPYSSHPDDRVKGFIYLSIDKGDNWTKKYHETDNVIINKIYFTDKNKGFIVGDFGYLAKTINGGDNWETLDLDNSNNLFNIYFSSNNNGIIISEGGIYSTINGGASWVSEDMKYSYYMLNTYFINDSLGWLVGKEGFIYKTETSFKVEYPESTTNTYNNYGINIFPNPATIRINVDLESINDVFYKLIDINGILCKKGYLHAKDNIDVSNLNTGIYILELYSEKTVIAREKIVKH